MKDIPIFDTETGVSTLVLKEIPYQQIAYVKVQSVQPGGLEAHLRECVSFCRMCGAERVLVTGHPELERHPVHCSIIPMACGLLTGEEPPANLFPVTEETAARWRGIYNERMKTVDNAATLTALDEKKILASGGAYFVHDSGTLLGIGWIEGSEVLCIAAVERGAGERVLRTLMSAADSDRVTLQVASTNHRAIRLYEKLGFIPCGEGIGWHTVWERGAGSCSGQAL